LQRKITQGKAAKKVGLSLSHISRHKVVRESYELLFYQRANPTPNKLPEDIRGEVITLKREGRGRSNLLISDLIFNKARIRFILIPGTTSLWRETNILAVGSRFFSYKEETLNGEVITEIHRKVSSSVIPTKPLDHIGAFLLITKRAVIFPGANAAEHQ